MAKWMYILLTGGLAPNGNKIFDSSLYFETFEPSSFLPMETPQMSRPMYPFSSESHAIALPWVVGSYRGMTE